MPLKYIFYLSILLILGSCSKENNSPSENPDFTPPQATQYVTTYQFNSKPDTISIVYNAEGQISERHFQNQMSHYEYENGALKKETNFYDFQLDTSHYERLYEYDDEQRVSKITHFDRPGTPELTAIYQHLFDYVSASKVVVTNRGIFYDYSGISHYFFAGANIEKIQSFSEDGDLTTEVFYTYTNVLRPKPFFTDWIANGLSSKHLPASVEIIDYTGLLDLACSFELDFEYETDNQGRALRSDNGCYTVDFEY